MTQETQPERDARISRLGQATAQRYLETKWRRAWRGEVAREGLTAAAFVLLIYMLTIIILAL